eukprot:5551616-Amphidinium_carterae.2
MRSPARRLVKGQLSESISIGRGVGGGSNAVNAKCPGQSGTSSVERLPEAASGVHCCQPSTRQPGQRGAGSLGESPWWSLSQHCWWKTHRGPLQLKRTAGCPPGGPREGSHQQELPPPQDGRAKAECPNSGLPRGGSSQAESQYRAARAARKLGPGCGQGAQRGQRLRAQLKRQAQERNQRQWHSDDLGDFIEGLHRRGNDVASLDMSPGTGGLAPILCQQGPPLTSRKLVVSPDLVHPLQGIPGRSTMQVH